MHTTARVADMLGGNHAMVGLLAATCEIATAAAEGGTRVALDNNLRRCDFSLVSTDAMVPGPALATGTVIVRTSRVPSGRGGTPVR